MNREEQTDYIRTMRDIIVYHVDRVNDETRAGIVITREEFIDNFLSDVVALGERTIDMCLRNTKIRINTELEHQIHCLQQEMESKTNVNRELMDIIEEQKVKLSNIHKENIVKNLEVKLAKEKEKVTKYKRLVYHVLEEI